MEVVKNIAAIVGCIVSIITLLTLTTKGGRKFIIKLFKTHTKDLVEMNEKQNQSIDTINETLNTILMKLDILETVSQNNCRNDIKNIYYKYHKEKKIPLYERRAADTAYDLYYNSLHGNSYALLLYKEICKWEIDSHVDEDLMEG